MRSRASINDGVAAILLLILALSPLPYGSNRPIYWMISAAFILAAMCLFFLQSPQRMRAHLFFQQLWVIILLILAYLGFIAAQSLFNISTTPRASFLAFLRTFAYAAFFFLMVQVSINKARRVLLAGGVFWVCVAYALLGYIQFVWQTELLAPFGFLHSQTSAHGPFINPNSYATYLGFGLLIGLSLLIRRFRQLRRFSHNAKIELLGFADIKLVAFALAIILIMVTLLATNSRMGVASSLIAVGFFLLLMAKNPRWINSRIVPLGLACIFLLILLVFSRYGSTLMVRLGSGEQGIDVRFALYQQVWDMVEARAFTGWGADSFPVAFQSFHRLPVSSDLVWNKAHNTYLTNWAELGLIIGSIPPLAGLILFKSLITKLLKQPQKSVFLLASLSALVQSALHSTVDFSLEIQANMYVFLAILALGTAQILAPDRRQNV